MLKTDGMGIGSWINPFGASLIVFKKKVIKIEYQFKAEKKSDK